MHEKITTTQLDQWRGKFGDIYSDRNAETAERVRVYTRAYGRMWECIAADPPATILECGCNVGTALHALSNITSAELYGIEPNATARAKAIASGVTAEGNIVEGCLQSIPFPDRHFDMAFTAGVLIHVEPDSLDKALTELGRVANKYVLMKEYFSKHLQPIEYRGQKEMLWKADYGELFMQKNPGWRPVEAGFFWDRLTGFDDTNWWVFKREEE